MRYLTLLLMFVGPLGLHAGCAEIGSMPGEEGDLDPGGDDGPGDPGGGEEDDGPEPVCLGDGQSGGACEVTGDCDAPLVCLDGACVGPRDPSITCDPIEGKNCEGENEVCVAGACVVNPGSCQTVDDCPLGYLCEGGSCVPEREGEACADPGPGPDLSGRWEVESTLHLREAIPEVLDGILDVSAEARNLMIGQVDLGLPSLVEFFIGGIVAGVIAEYVPPWAQDVVGVLGDLSDVLNNMRVESTITLEGQPCEGSYRGTERWDYITFNYRGNELRVPPSQLPGVDEIVPDEFSATYSCGKLYIDRHRIKESMGELVRWLTNTLTQAVSGHQTIEDALYNLVDCYQVGLELDYQLYQVCSSCPIITGVVDAACTGLKVQAINKLGEKINEATVKMSLIKRRGIVQVEGADRMGAGTWYGSLAGGDFPGEFSMQRD